MWPSRCAIFGVLLAMLSRPGVARAQEARGDREAIHVLVEGSAACLSETRFFEQVEARTSRVRRADAGTTARTFVVGVRPEPGGYGYCSEYRVEQFWRDAKMMEIGGGTAEAHQKNITRDLVR